MSLYILVEFYQLGLLILIDLNNTARPGSGLYIENETLLILKKC